MKRKMHIRTKLLITLVSLVSAVLLIVALAVNLSIRGYIRSRVSSQLRTASDSAMEERGEKKHGDDSHEGRMNNRTNALVVSNDGEVISVLHGFGYEADVIAAYIAQNGLSLDGSYSTVTAGDAVYAVSAAADPVESGAYLVSYIDITDISSLSARLNLFLIIIVLAAVLLSVVLSRLFARSFSKPVNTLSDFARDIGGGDFTPRELSFKELEFDTLAVSMNSMASELREAKRKQEIFYQNVSHELRTPLTSIRGSAEGIVCGVMEPETAAKVILSESDRLGAMVEDILYLARADRGAVDTNAEPIDMRELLSLCVSEHRTEADGKGVSFIFDFDGEPVMYPMREQDGERLFGNLISNAIRYAKKNITLSCRGGDRITVSVRDDGQGVSDADMPHVFERFYKGEGGRHGIGLSIAKSVADAYGGEISVKNDGGAVFTVSFS